MYNKIMKLSVIAMLFCCEGVLAGEYSETNITNEEDNTSSQSTNRSADVMVVSAGRGEQSLWDSPVTMQVISREELDKATGDSIAETLRDIPGISISDNALSGRKQIMIRGESSSRVLVLIDGQENTYHRSGQNTSLGLLLDASMIERIEVVKGPHSVLYGSQAIAGVINFITRKGGDKPIEGSISTIYDSATAGWQNSGVTFGSLGNFEYRINANYSDHGNRDTPDGRLENTNFRNTGQGIWLGYKLDQHHFGLSLDQYKLSTQTYYESDAYNEFSVKIPKLERQKVGLFYDYKVDENGVLNKIHVDTYIQKLSRKFVNIMDMDVMTGLNTTVEGRINDDQTTTGATLQVDLHPFANDQLIVGGQFLHDSVNDDSASSTIVTNSLVSGRTSESISEKTGHMKWKQTSWALFAQNELKVVDDLKWVLGGRQSWISSKNKGGSDYNSSTSKINGITSSFTESSGTIAATDSSDQAFVISTGLSYTGIENTELRFSFAQGFVYPTLSHLYNTTSKGGVTIYGNKDLDPERSNNFEIGGRYNGNDWLIDGAIYYSDAKDYIASISCNGSAICDGNVSSSATYYANANRAKTYGAELNIEYNGWLVSPYAQLNYLHRKLTLTNKKTSDVGEPAYTGRTGLRNVTVFDTGIELESDFFIRVASKTVNKTSSTTYKYNGWATMNLAFTTRFGESNQYRVNLALNNLTDKRYQTAHESIPASGFSAAIGFGMNF